MNDSISRLSRKLLRTPIAEDGRVFIDSSDWETTLAQVDSPAREQASELVRAVRDGIPSDFSFLLVFTYSGVEISTTFEDGNTGADAGTAFFASFKSLRRSLRRTDWDEMRRAGIEGGNIFDELLSEAADRPANIPSSKEAAELHSAELTKALADIRSRIPLPAFALVVTRDDVGFGIETFSTRDEVVSIIADRMTTQCDILAVLERGVCWSWDEIESAKAEAVEQLGPISRAKAERRFLV
jgi:hypothetical protein